MNTVNRSIKLPRPAHDGKLALEAAFLGRRSIRDYRQGPLDLNEISQLLWAAQGIVRPGGYRTCPSAGALYPLELQVVAGAVEGLPCGCYRYDIANHAMLLENERDIRGVLATAALGQSMISRAPATIAISAIFERTTRRYGERGMRYVFMEAGHAAQNIHLQAVSLNLGTVVIGAFRDEEVKRVMGFGPRESPLLLMPVGRI
ncbi:MAG TPA: SagB/ThcOx family dehydrogenase [Syntrophobacteraceae bacterium]|nr:SagB/ThcOx family dehydrogenase [Syntrophobacteraceae bacterium]